MELDAKTIHHLWDTIREYVPANKREELITSILEILVDNDVDIDDKEDLYGTDDDMDAALEEVFDDIDFDDDY